MPAQSYLTLVTSCTVFRQALLFMEHSRQEYWSRLPFPTPGDLPNPGIEPESLVFPAWAGDFFFFYHCTTWEALKCLGRCKISFHRSEDKVNEDRQGTRKLFSGLQQNCTPTTPPCGELLKHCPLSPFPQHKLPWECKKRARMSSGPDGQDDHRWQAHGPLSRLVVRETTLSFGVPCAPQKEAVQADGVV